MRQSVRHLVHVHVRSSVCWFVYSLIGLLRALCVCSILIEAFAWESTKKVVFFCCIYRRRGATATCSFLLFGRKISKFVADRVYGVEKRRVYWLFPCILFWLRFPFHPSIRRLLRLPWPSFSRSDRKLVFFLGRSPTHAPSVPPFLFAICPLGTQKAK